MFFTCHGAGWLSCDTPRSAGDGNLYAPSSPRQSTNYLTRKNEAPVNILETAPSMITVVSLSLNISLLS